MKEHPWKNTSTMTLRCPDFDWFCQSRSNPGEFCAYGGHVKQCGLHGQRSANDD
jgi:hypothetical protein